MLEFNLPEPSENTIKRCNELLLVYTFKAVIYKIKPEHIERFISANAMTFGLKDSDVATIFSLTRNDLTMFTVKEVCVCAFHLNKQGIRANEILKMFNIKKSKYDTTLKLYMAYDNGEELIPKIEEEKVEKLNLLIELLSSLAENIITAKKVLGYIKEN